MDQKLLYRLRSWRAAQAQREGVEVFRVLPNTTLEEIARTVPKTSSEFLKIKGIKEGRWKKYGAMLSVMVADAVPPESVSDDADPTSIFDEAKAVDAVLDDSTDEAVEDVSVIPGRRTLYTVSDFLEALNGLFAEMTVRVKGEVSSVDTRDKTTYFTLKDPQDGSLLSCLVFRYQYSVSGVVLKTGQEVIVEGVPGIWKPTGRLSLKVGSIEVSGEGALQKAYDDLRLKLESEGVFSAASKRALPEFPERIALITSNQGAAIGDFMMNLGKFGFKVTLLNANVEGKRAVLDLLDAVRFFNRDPDRYDVLVIIRGGGSLESLQAFNNEALVRAVAGSSIPTLCGIGHEKDVSLVALAGDVMVSTPTATARVLRESFERAEASIIRFEQGLLTGFGDAIRHASRRCDSASSILLRRLGIARERCLRIQHAFFGSIERLRSSMRDNDAALDRYRKTMEKSWRRSFGSVQESVLGYETKLSMHDPKRLLRLGYSLILKNGGLVRSVRDLKPGDDMVLQLSDGYVAAKAGDRLKKTPLE